MSYFDEQENFDEQEETLEEQIQEQYKKLVVLYRDNSTPPTDEYLQSYQTFDRMMRKHLYSLLTIIGTEEQFQQYEDDPEKLDCYFAMLIKESIPLSALRKKTQETLLEAVTSEGPLLSPIVETTSLPETPSLSSIKEKKSVEPTREIPPLRERKKEWSEIMLYILGKKEDPDKGIVRIDTYLQNLSDRGIHIEKWDFLNSVADDVMIVRQVYRYYLRDITSASCGMIAEMFLQGESIVSSCGVNRVKRLLSGGDLSIRPYLEILGLEKEIETLEKTHAIRTNEGKPTNLLFLRNQKMQGRRKKYGDESATFCLALTFGRRYLIQLLWLSGGEMNIKEDDFWNGVQDGPNVQSDSSIGLAQQMFWYNLQLKGKRIDDSVDAIALIESLFNVKTPIIHNGIKRIEELIQTNDKRIQPYLPLFEPAKSVLV